MAINKGRESVLKAIAGYYIEDVTTEVRHRPDTNENVSIIRKVKKYVPADVTAIIFVLKTFDSKNFGGKQEIISQEEAREISRLKDIPDELLFGDLLEQLS